MSHELSKEEKLKKIIEKAKLYELTGPVEFMDASTIKFYVERGVEIVNIYELIFSPEFAKAYFGEEEVCKLNGDWDIYKGCNCIYNSEFNQCQWIERFKYHQHQLLTEIQEERDSIDYLYKFID